jgi:hypothetical protein
MLASKRFIKPAIVHGDLVHAVGRAAFADFKRAVCAWSAAEAECDAQYDAERAEAMELHRQRKRQTSRKDAPLRRCDDCALVLGRNCLRALEACPRWGLVRAGVEGQCGAFVAKAGA